LKQNRDRKERDVQGRGVLEIVKISVIEGRKADRRLRAQKGLRRGDPQPREDKMKKLPISPLGLEYQTTWRFQYCEACIF